MKNEPIITVSTVTTVVTATIVLLAAFGLNITPEQKVAITGFAGVVAPIVIAFIARKYTIPVSKAVPKSEVVEREVDGLVIAGPASELPTGTTIRDAGSLVLGDEHEQVALFGESSIERA